MATGDMDTEATATGAIPDILIRRMAMQFRPIPIRHRHLSTAIMARPTLMAITEVTVPMGAHMGRAIVVIAPIGGTIIGTASASSNGWKVAVICDSQLQ